MNKRFLILAMLLIVSGLACESAQINYDGFGRNSLGEEYGSVSLQGDRYKVKTTTSSIGQSMEIKNSNSTYRGNLDQWGNGTLKDKYGNKIKVRSGY